MTQDLEKKALLPKIYGVALIQNLFQNLCDKGSAGDFKDNHGLAALCKSQTFFFEIFEFFTSLNSCKINVQTLFKILNSVEINTHDKKRLELIFDVYREFTRRIDDSNYSIPQITAEKSHNEMPQSLNLWAKELTDNFQKRCYIEFNDMQSEIIFIAHEIKDLVEKDFKSWEDFGIFTTDSLYKRTLAEIFNALKIPTNYNELNENFIQFRIKFEQFLNICEIFYSLNLVKIDNIVLENTYEHFPKNYEEINTLLDNLNTSNQDLANIYELYKNSDFTGIISYLAQKERIDEGEINAKTGRLLNFYKNVVKSRPGNNLIINVIDDILYNSKNNSKKAVTIFSNKRSLDDKRFKSLYLPGLIETAFTNKEYIYFISQKTNNEISNEIRKTAPDFENIIPYCSTNLDIEKFSDTVKLSTETITLSAFNYFETKQIQPSVIFDLFKNIDGENFLPPAEKKVENEIKTNEKDFKNPKKETVKIIEQNEILKLNPSAISNFQNCPKKYFYKNLLKLKEQGDFHANYGSIAHAILEVFNKNCLEKYNKDEMLKLCDTLFLAKILPENALNAGFDEIDIKLVQSSDDMALAQMRDNFYDAVSGLVETGFFNNIPKETHCEEKFEFELPEIPNVIFNGRIDCISNCTSKDGENYTVIDYKTGKDKPGDKPLQYYASESGVNFLNKKGQFDEKLIDKYKYQIPIYYLGIKNAASLSRFKDNTEKFMLEYVRPKNVNGGYKQDAAPTNEFESVKEKIIKNLKEKVVDVIKAQSEFLPKPELYKCLNCSYSFLCDGLGLEDAFEDAPDE